MDISETGLICRPRYSRALVMDSVLADINFAADNLRVNDNSNTVNRDVALALKSRISLYEGTYRNTIPSRTIVMRNSVWTIGHGLFSFILPI